MVLPWSIVSNGSVDPRVVDGVDCGRLVIHDDVVVEPVTPQDLVRHVGRPNLNCVSGLLRDALQCDDDLELRAEDVTWRHVVEGTLVVDLKSF